MSTVTNTVTTDIQDSVSNLYIAFFGRAPDAQGFGYWAEKMAEGVSPFTIAADFALSNEWLSNYGGLTPEQQVNLFYQNTFGRDADQEGLDYWVASIEGGLPFSTVAYQIINAAYLGGPNVDPDDNALVLNKIEVAEYFAITLKSNDTSLAATAFSGVTTDPATVTAAEARLAADSAESYTLTTGTDIIYGTDNDDVFQGDAVPTALIPAQTLNTTDNLNGGAGYNILNAELVNLYTVPAGLTNIQEINLSQPSSPISGLGLIPVNALDLINANDTQVLGFNGFASISSSTQIEIINVQTELDTINFSNIVSSGEDGFAVGIQNIGTTLSGDADALAVNIANVNGIVSLELEQTQDPSAGYETVNISATGSSTETVLELVDANATVNTVNLTGSATNFGVAGSALDLTQLRTFNASTFTGDLDLEFTGAAVNADEEIQAVSVTGALGDNDIFFNGTTANLTVTTFAGDDVVNVNTPLVMSLIEPPAFTAFGDATINVGEGDNEVVVTDLAGNVVIAAGDGENLIDILNVEGDVTVIAGDGGNGIFITDVDLDRDEDDAIVAGIITVATGAGDDDLYLDTARFSADELSQGAGVVVDLGAGDNTLFLGGEFTGSVSFADSKITNVDNLVVTTAVYVPGSVDATVDITELAGTLQSVTFEQLVTVKGGGSITIDGAPLISSLTFDAGAEIKGLLQINDVQDLTLNVGAGTSMLNTNFFFEGKNGNFVAADLETLTINLDEFSTFKGVTSPEGTDVNNLTTVTVNGVSVDSDFTMDFDTEQSGAIQTIDLSGFSGDAVVNVFSVTKGESFGDMDITIGDGNLEYNINDSSFANANQDEFIFTEDFGGVDIAGFEIGGSATSDDLNLSVFGIQSGSELIFNITADDDMSIVSRNGDFVGEIILVGTYDDFAITTVAALNIIYA